MKYGRLAVKRLAAVEVRPDRSHQHEFNAGKLRAELGFERERTSGRMDVILVGGGGPEPRSDVGRYTIYDAREAHPTRTEFRLYYDAPLIAEDAHEGDLLVLFRVPAGKDLRAVVARKGSVAEHELLDALFVADDETLARFQFVEPEPLGPSESSHIADVLGQDLPPSAFDVMAHPVFGSALKDGRYPTTKVMAHAARELVENAYGRRLDPDTYIDAALTAETDLYFAIEDKIDGGRLHDLAEGGLGLAEVLEFAMRIQQSRKSRRGQSLQNHFAVVLDGAGMKYSAQCGTELGERPDFMLPSCEAYHDDAFEPGRLRIVACKSTAKERWRQVLNEAARVDEKYLLTLDSELTDDLIRSMQASRLRAFLPEPVLSARYEGRATRPMLGTVADLLVALQATL